MKNNNEENINIEVDNNELEEQEIKINFANQNSKLFFGVKHEKEILQRLQEFKILDKKVIFNN